MLTRTIFIYSVTYKVNLLGKAFADVRNCLRKEKHMYGTNKNIDGFYTKTTQICGFRVKFKKKVLYRPTPFFNTYTVSIIWYLFTVESYFDSRIASSFFILFFFFLQEKTLGDISFKLETKIMNFMTGFFFEKKYNQVNSSVVNNMQYNLFTIFPLSGPFAEFGFVFIDYITYFRF